MSKSAHVLSITFLLAAVSLVAQVAGPSPLASEQAASAAVPATLMLDEGRADIALQMGFSATAAGGYREILSVAGVPVETKSRVTLSLVTALLDAGEIPEAGKVLQAYSGPKNSTYQLRVALLAVFERRFGPAKTALASGKIEELPEGDIGWWHFAQAQIADSENDTERRNAAYAQAGAMAVSALQRTRFALGQDLAILRRAPLDENRLNDLKKTIDAYQGQRIGYENVRYYAAGLATAQRVPEAQALLQRQLATVPPTERNTADQLRLLLGMIAGEKSTIGRNALKELVKSAQRQETQRLALHLLARGATTEPDRAQLRRDLTELVGLPTPHPIIEDLLLVRAQLALIDKQYAAAEEDARSLLGQFPGTPLKAEALGVRLAVAWDLKRYRAAADLSTQLRALLPAGRERAELGVLLAEAFFRASDYKSASDAYGAALSETPAVVAPGILIFQRVLSDIHANQLESAANQLDAAANNPALDPLNRWQAEWNLVKEMQVRGLSAQAAARVEKVLASGAQGVPEDLRIRLMWLRARLAFDTGQFEIAMQQTDELTGVLEKANGLEAGLRGDVASTSLLLKGQALFELKRDQEALVTLEKLRKEYQGSSAAQDSFLEQASQLEKRGDLAGAQRILQTFVDTKEYAKSPFVPFALYRIALILERQGLDRHLQEAYGKNVLERLVQDFPRDEMVFYARLKQGDLLRKLNDFAAARQIYENLVNNESRHPDVLLAQIALADCMFAQAANSAVNYEGASAIYERLRDLPSAPVDLRAEAGFKWGYALAKRSQTQQGQVAKDQAAKAQTVLWSVVDAFLLDANVAKQLGPRGRDWVARALVELGQLHEAAGRFDEAQRAYQLIIDNKLKGTALAESKLARFRPVETTKS
ncbi:tetratricopeptide repeat protein [Oleiharenicola lentus]|uniref:tetratricopeptide repeat protein n=1 Tax=Oleiharenicola lentus TaxID=2508720 RepID=UPI003F674E63